MPGQEQPLTFATGQTVERPPDRQIPEPDPVDPAQPCRVRRSEQPGDMSGTQRLHLCLLYTS